MEDEARIALMRYAVRVAGVGHTFGTIHPTWASVLGCEPKLTTDELSGKLPEGITAVAADTIVPHGLEWAVRGYMLALPAGGVLLVHSTLAVLLADAAERAQPWRNRWRVHTVFYSDVNTAIGWWTVGRYSVDSTIKLIPYP